MADLIREFKKQRQAERRAADQRYRELRRIARHCFWTWPFGHLWMKDQFTKTCEACGYRKNRWDAGTSYD